MELKSNKIQNNNDKKNIRKFSNNLVMPPLLHLHGEYQCLCTTLADDIWGTPEWQERYRWHNRILRLQISWHDEDLPPSSRQCLPPACSALLLQPRIPRWRADRIHTCHQTQESPLLHWISASVCCSRTCCQAGCCGRTWCNRRCETLSSLPVSPCAVYWFPFSCRVHSLRWDCAWCKFCGASWDDPVHSSNFLCLRHNNSTFSSCCVVVLPFCVCSFAGTALETRLATKEAANSSLTKIGTNENKGIYSICLLSACPVNANVSAANEVDVWDY